MSKRNRDGKYEAQMRLEKQRAREQARARAVRRTAVLLSALAVAITAVAVAVAFHSGGSAHTYDATTDAPTGTVGPDRLTIRLGMPAPATLTVYEEPGCAACGRFERDFHTTIEQLQRQGRLQVDYRILSSVDRRDSHQAAEALACAQNSGRFSGLHDLLFDRETAPSDDNSQQTLTQLAGQVPGLDSAAFSDCLAHGTYSAWVDAVQADFDHSGHTSDPTVLLSGVPAYPTYHGTPTTPAQLTAWVDHIDGVKP